MKPSELSVALRAMIPARRPVLLVGPPGVGKSNIVEQTVRELGYDLILSHPAVSDPTDAKGLPWVGKDGDSATFLPFGELAQALNATTPTVWFLDDLGQAPPAVQASFMQLLLARRVNGHALPDCVTFIAATNRRTDRAGVMGILEPVKSRFATIVHLEPDLDDWCAWAYRNAVPHEIVAFLRFRPELFCAFEPSADLGNSPLPRTWENAGGVLDLPHLPVGVRNEMINGAVGAGAGAEFAGFLALYRDLPSIDGILTDPETAKIPRTPGGLYAVAAGLAMRANALNFSRVIRYVERLLDDGHGEFSVLTMRDIVRRDTSLTSTPEYTKLMSGPLGQLIVGTAAV